MSDKRWKNSRSSERNNGVSRNRLISQEKPEPFDLVTVIFKNGKTQNAWWTGAVWDSMRDINSEPEYWRKRYEHD